MHPDILAEVTTFVSHADCPDGIASALILRDAIPGAELVFLEHNTPEQRSLPAEPGLLFCDIVPDAERVAAFVDAGTVVLDHHRGARDVVEAFGARGVFADERADPGVSGAMLAYREVWLPLRGEDPEVRRFAELAGVRDTWQRADPGWSEACAQATALTFFGYEALRDEGPRLAPLRQEVGRLLVAQREATAREIADGKTYRLRDDVVMYNDRDRLLSDVAAQVFQSDEAVQVVCGFHYKVTSDGRMLLVCSLRSRRDGVDVAAIARRQGGGGHTSAAGFGVPVDGQADPTAVLRAALTATGG